MKAPKIILIIAVGVTCLFIIYSNEYLNSHLKFVYYKTHVVKPKTYPKYYEDNVHVEWPFIITKTYPESDTYEWSEPTNFRSPDAHGVGENGSGYMAPDDNMTLLMEKLQNENKFNLLASEMMSLHRSLPDPRYGECKSLSYPEKLPTASVIVIFHNEAWTTLLRTVWSVIDRSPIELIKEIVLVDDLSTWPILKRPLYDYIAIFPVRIKLIRNAKREGLIRARIIGAQHATGQVLIFLDAHSECCDGWLQPLLARIATDRSIIAVPLIDTISSSDMSYTWNQAGTPIHGFRWNLLYNWYKKTGRIRRGVPHLLETFVHKWTMKTKFKKISIPEKELIRTRYDKAAPVRTPTMVGCAFAMDKEFFFEVGAYDEGMNVWGSENMEISLRVWQCGGSMEIIPCSHVGHLFRASTYSFEGNADEIIARNSIRLVEVWMPEFKDFFYAVNPKAKSFSGGDISDRIALKQRLKCKTFRWYLENVYPQSSLNTKYLHFGEIRSLSKNQCLDIGRSFSGDPVILFTCHNQGGNQVYGLSSAQLLITSQEQCIGVVDGIVVSLKCTDAPKWQYGQETKWLVHIGSGLCMQAQESNVTLGNCDPTDDTFNWIFN